MMQMLDNKPEILSPAGDFECLRSALSFGADAVFLAGKAFGMRSAPRNFDEAELKAACRLAHSMNRHIHLTCNTLPRNNELEALPDFLAMAQDCGVDALIIADMGVFEAAKRYAPKVARHVSTQAGVTNYASANVRAVMASCLTNKYAEGYPHRRYYGGCEYVDEVEERALERAKLLFGAEHVNVQPHAGSQANMAAYMALLQPGDVVLGMTLNSGGHLTHGSLVNFSGKLYRFSGYGTNSDGRIDYDDLRAQAKTLHPRMIVAGASAYPRAIDFSIFRLT